MATAQKSGVHLFSSREVGHATVIMMQDDLCTLRASPPPPLGQGVGAGAITACLLVLLGFIRGAWRIEMVLKLGMG